MLDTYVAFLAADEIELVESLRSSDIVSLFPQIVVLDVSERLLGRGAPARVLGHDMIIVELREHEGTLYPQ